MRAGKLNIFALIMLIMASTSLVAQSTEKHVKVAASPSVAKVSKGDEFTVRVKIDIDEGWYTYGVIEKLNEDFIGPTPTEITFEPKEALTINKLNAEKPKTKQDAGYEMEIDYYKHNASFDLLVKAEKDLDFSMDAVKAVVYLQLCTDTKCLPPEEYKSDIAAEIFDESVTFEIQSDSKSEDKQIEEAPAETADSKEFKTQTQKDLDEAREKGIIYFIIFAAGFGGISLLMPCVFPMIPITVSFFTKRAEENKGGSGLKDATAYALGIVAFFTSLGFIFSLIFGPAGIQEFAKNPWVFLFIAGIFILFTFNLLGAFEIQMPTGLMNKLNKKSQDGKGIAAVLIMSLTFSLASFSCTGPFVGAVLMSASQGEWFYPIVGMIAFSAVLAAPFFLLALFPSALTSMPRAGSWMNNIKIVMAFIVLPTSLYFLSNAFVDFGIGFLTREVFLSITAGCMLLNFLYLLGVFRTEMDAPVQHMGVTRMFLALIFAALTLFFMSGLFGRQLGELETFLPQSETIAAVGGNSASHSDWLTNYDEALAKAKEENKPIFIDFTGKKCTNCKKMERTIFPKPEIQERFEKMIPVKLITDMRGEPYESNKKMQQDMFHTVEIPMYVVVKPNGEVIDTKAFTSDPAEFAAFLDKALK